MITFCLEAAGITPYDLDHVGISRDPSANLMKKILLMLARRPSLDLIRERLANQMQVRRPDVALCDALRLDPGALRPDSTTSSTTGPTWAAPERAAGTEEKRMTQFWSGKRVLITGVSGFVGPYLASELLEHGAIVHGVLRTRADRLLSRGLLDRGLTSDVKFLEADIEELYGLLHVMEEVQPDVVFHLAAQSFVKSSFENPLLVTQTNSLGTANLLEALRLRAPQARLVFAGSSEEYGLVFMSPGHYQTMRDKYGEIFPAPERLPEVPIRETNPLRPMSPYAVSKVHGDHLIRSYAHAFGLHGVVARAFNHEGGGRGIVFVTSQITSQAVGLALHEVDVIRLGDVNSFRDWSHVRDIIAGYLILAERGARGGVYNLGSGRTNSVLTYLLLALQEVGWTVRALQTLRGTKSVEAPAEMQRVRLWGTEFDASRVDHLMLTEGLTFEPGDEGLVIATARGDVRLLFDPQRMRPSDVPILMCDASRSRGLGFRSRISLAEIVRDQINYYHVPRNRQAYPRL